MGRILLAWICGLGVALLLTSHLATAATAAGDEAAAVRLRMLNFSAAGVTADAVTAGALDSHFVAITPAELRQRGGTFWLKLERTAAGDPLRVPVMLAREGHDPRVRLFVPVADPAPFNATGASPTGARYLELPGAADLPEFGGLHEVVFILPRGLTAGQALYALVAAPDSGFRHLHFRSATLDAALQEGAAHARMIALAFGALLSLSLGALLIWFILQDLVFLLYAALISTQALYVVYLSGQGFAWPLLSYATPLASYAWNVPAALGGIAASLFVREIADLRRSLPRAYAAFGWLAVAFAALTLANFIKLFGFEDRINALGNLLFIGACIFTLVASFLSWRRGNRAAGWFLLAWGVFEAFTIATSLVLLLNGGEGGQPLLYAGYPLSMVAAAVLIALGVADRLNSQRIALSEAERRAQTDPLTGVMNRRSLLERLDAACARARARGLPISLLFIDLDHFKEINDTFGHQAGDACLAAIIPPIHSELRQSDAIGRYGGEEFVVILSSADAAAAHPIAERIRKRVADIRVDGYGETIRLTCSIGIATSDTLGVWGQHLIARADAAVYAAKRAGRNRVQFAEPMAA